MTSRRRWEDLARALGLSRRRTSPISGLSSEEIGLDQSDMLGTDHDNDIDHDLPSSFVRTALLARDPFARRVPFVLHASAHVQHAFCRPSLSSGPFPPLLFGAPLPVSCVAPLP